MAIDTSWMLDLVPKRPEAIEFEVLDDEIVLYNTVWKTLIHLNASAALVFGLCDGNRTVRDIMAAIAARFPEADRNISDDVAELIDRACEEGILVFWRSHPLP